MLKRIFGKTSTGVVYLICASSILLSGVSAFLLFYFLEIGHIFDILFYLSACVVALIFLTVPVFVYRRFKLHIPAFLQVTLSVYIVAVYGLARSLFSLYGPTRSTVGDTGVTVNFIPFFTGFIVAMTAFSIVYSVLSRKAKPTPKKTALYTLMFSLLAVGIGELVLYFAAPLGGDDSAFLFSASGAVVAAMGAIVFTAIGAVQVKNDKAEMYRIVSMRNLEKAKLKAEQEDDPRLRNLIEIEENRPDMKHVFLSAKAKFLLGKLIYLGIYAGYLSYIIYHYVNGSGLRFYQIATLSVAFGLNVAASVYSYILFKKNIKNKRMYVLKIIYNVVRIATLALTIMVMYTNERTLLVTTFMTAFCFVNVFVNITGMIVTHRRNAAEAAEEKNTDAPAVNPPPQ